MLSKFFERRLCRWVGIGVFGADRDPPKAQLVQVFAHRAFVERDAEFRFDPARKIGAHGVRACIDPGRKLRHLIRSEPGFDPTATTIDQSVGAFGIVPMHSVTQGLPIHAAALGSGLARRPLQGQGNRQKPPRHLAILHAPRRSAQVLRRHVIARNLHRHICLHIDLSD